MKNIISNFFAALIATMLYSALIQYTDTGTVDLIELILTLRPWIIALVVTAGIFVWSKLFTKKEAEETKV